MGAMTLDEKRAMTRFPPEPARETAHFSPARRPRVLVVEDDERVRSALADLLDGWGFQVTTAIDGTEGWKKIEAVSPAVVVSDFQMPGLTGLDLLKRTRDFDPGIF